MAKLRWARVSAGIYRNAETGYRIERQDAGVKFAAFSQHNWYLKDPGGKVCAIEQTKDELEIRAERILRPKP